MILCIALAAALTGCGGSDSTGGSAAPSGSSSAAEAGSAPEIPGLTYESTMELKYADQFAVYDYEGGYSLIDIVDEGQFLVVPEDGEVPEGLSEDITVLQKPLDRIYLAATASMALFASMDGTDHIRMSSLQASGWSMDSVKELMKKGDIIYAGKYSEPDYETMLDEGCNLAIESTMIYHSPEVQEMIEDLGIPVLIDRSSYESNPLGRTEWIKLYATLTDDREAADKFFEGQIEQIKELEDFKNTEKTVAYFYISTDGKAIVKSTDDYTPTMIEMAGGRYIFKQLLDETGKTSIPMSIEKFYDTAADADIIVYNGSIDSTVKTLEDLKEKDPILKDFKAVKEGNCYVTGTSMYQRTDLSGEMIMDFHKLVAKDGADMKFISKLE